MVFWDSDKRYETRLRGLYAITDTRLTPAVSIHEKVAAALSGGAGIVQLREKHMGDREFLDLAVALKKLCRNYGALFIVNDRIDLACSADADGVHLGKEDADAEDIKGARRYLKGKIIGISCYDDLERAKEMEKLGVDYVAFGSFFSSPTKPGAVRAPISLIRQAKESLSLPVCAIGGITAKNASILVKAGADMLAVISDLWTSQDIIQRSREFSRLFE